VAVQRFDVTQDLARIIKLIRTEQASTHHKAHRTSGIHHVATDATVQVFLSRHRIERCGSILVTDIFLQHAATDFFKVLINTLERIRRNVMDTRRAVSFMMRSKMLNAEQFEEARQILRDIDSLDSHTAFLFDKINFLMDATVGFININQNKIIKIFSVASVALLPPTLIASLYGMNFQYMPELTQVWGYPYALALMVASAVVPMWYFRRRGWLK